MVFGHNSSKFGSGGFEEIKTYEKFLAYIIMFQNVNKKTACTITINRVKTYQPFKSRKRF